MLKMKISNLNNYSIAELIFNETLVWAASDNPSLSKEQFCADIERVLDKVENKNNTYRKGYDAGYSDAKLNLQ